MVLGAVVLVERLWGTGRVDGAGPHPSTLTFEEGVGAHGLRYISLQRAQPTVKILSTVTRVSWRVKILRRETILTKLFFAFCVIVVAYLPSLSLTRPVPCASSVWRSYPNRPHGNSFCLFSLYFIYTRSPARAELNNVLAVEILLLVDAESMTSSGGEGWEAELRY